MVKSAILSEIAEAESLYAEAVTGRYTAIRTGEQYSTAKIDEIRAYVSQNPPPSDADIHFLAAAGSLARKEASKVSDVDLIVVTNDELTESAQDSLDRWRRDLCSALNLEQHNPRGVFARPVQLSKVLASAGSEKEDYSNVSIRVLLLLESDWILNQDNHSNAVDAIIDEYSSDIKGDPRKNFVFLLNDVIRYFRTICVNYQYTKSETDDGKWPIRNIKLRHSRVLMYFSMVSAIGVLSRVHTPQKIEALKQLTALPPLKRLFVCYRLAGDPSYYKVAGLYDVFLDVLSAKNSRDELKGLEHIDRYDSRVFAHLKATSDALCSELLRFYEARRDDWDDRFFEYMIV